MVESTQIQVQQVTTTKRNMKCCQNRVLSQLLPSHLGRCASCKGSLLKSSKDVKHIINYLFTEYIKKVIHHYPCHETNCCSSNEKGRLLSKKDKFRHVCYVHNWQCHIVTTLSFYYPSCLVNLTRWLTLCVPTGHIWPVKYSPHSSGVKRHILGTGN